MGNVPEEGEEDHGDNVDDRGETAQPVDGITNKLKILKACYSIFKINNFVQWLTGTQC